MTNVQILIYMFVAGIGTSVLSAIMKKEEGLLYGFFLLVASGLGLMFILTQ